QAQSPLPIDRGRDWADGPDRQLRQPTGRSEDRRSRQQFRDGRQSGGLEVDDHELGIPSRQSLTQRRPTMADWLPFARKLPVTYNRQQMPQGTPILGAVLHTTDAGGVQTLERFQRDWQAKQDQTAHFMVDRAGNIGQFRALNEVAWHFRRYLSTQY